LRTATRILKPILDFPAYQYDDLYHNVLKHDFTKYIRVQDTLAIESVVRESQLKDQRMVSLKIKDAIVDQFREKFGSRPDVDTDNPALKVVARLVKNQVSLAIDTSGQSLSLRGYRTESGEAPLREHLAAGLIEMMNWDEKQTIYDPMCGSGTLLIEAALKAKKIAPGTLRKNFSFQKFLSFQEDVWRKLVEEALDKEVKETDLKLYGSDINGKLVRIAVANAERAATDDMIEFFKKSVTEIEPPTPEPGIIIVNPPYGERLGVTHELSDVYKDLAYSLKRKFQGWTLWLLSGNEELTRDLRLKAEKRIPVMNGNIECRFLMYPIKSSI
jgi:putative N6-adenine-specific DNA methylase